MSLGITIRDVEMVYSGIAGEVHALVGINLEITPGEFVCLLGESGCGKSTLLRLLAGLQMPTSGSIRVGGERVTGPDHRRGVVFQSPSLLPWLNVESNVSLGFRIREQPVPTDTIKQTLEMVGLEGFERAKPQNLSGGMAQRAAIARALVNAPSVLLMDEPFGALDAITRLKMQQEIQRIWKSQGITIVFVTHDIDEAVVLGSRIVVMTPRPGRIGRIFQVPLGYPRSSRSADFMRLKSTISNELMELEIEADTQ